MRVTSASLTGRMKKLRESLAGAMVLRRVKALGGKLDVSQRKVVVDEIDRLRGVLEELSRAIKG